MPLNWGEFERDHKAQKEKNSVPIIAMSDQDIKLMLLLQMLIDQITLLLSHHVVRAGQK